MLSVSLTWQSTDRDARIVLFPFATLSLSSIGCIADKQSRALTVATFPLLASRSVY